MSTGAVIDRIAHSYLSQLRIPGTPGSRTKLLEIATELVELVETEQSDPW